jgi:CheY-like chemotaxis protein
LRIIVGDENGDGVGYFSRHQYSVSYTKKNFHTNRAEPIARPVFLDNFFRKAFIRGSMRPLKILHIEDNEEDLILFERACEAAGLPAEFHPVRDGFEAVAYLKGGGPFADRTKHPLPDLIVLDLSMPGMGGFDFLKWLRQESELSSLPVLIFTVSANADDKARALAEGATGYFIKPRDFEGLVRLTESFRKFKGDGPDKNNEAT